ncbi:hypothetical protein E1301_Tti006484 [Triplophysa tibetana]|uniref:Uncharacterized protein n=1 Tax=Triplophysa tibetana TaxID=1572043 RepID=A0A5A9P1R5_9TELE|nr:hypothetical protein E1301_Tti006484 [Triplophysa tibetana]
MGTALTVNLQDGPSSLRRGVGSGYTGKRIPIRMRCRGTSYRGGYGLVWSSLEAWNVRTSSNASGPLEAMGYRSGNHFRGHIDNTPEGCTALSTVVRTIEIVKGSGLRGALCQPPPGVLLVRRCLFLISVWERREVDLVMSRACPELHWRWLELHDSVSMGSGERRVRTATGTRQWRIHRRPKPRYSVLDERRLHYAAWEGCLEQVKAMLEHGVPANCQDSYGWTAVHHASFKGHLPLVKFIMQTGQVEVNSQDFFNCTPLHRSCSGGNPDTTEFLLQKGASHEARSCSGQTPLHLATANGHLGTARVLLQHLASPNPQDFHKWTPLHWALFGGWGDVVELLLDNGADVEGGRGVGMSPLQLAVLVGNEAGVRLLLHRGADANTRGPNGQTALHLCASYGDKKILQHLLKGGAKLDIRDGDVASPLHLAARSGSRAVVHLLILNGAGLEDRDNLKMTPLHYTMLRDNAEAAKLLLHYGADVNARERLGQTPLHLASERGHLKVLKVLLDKGADPFVRSSWRETAEDVARTHNQPCILHLLQQHQMLRRRDQDAKERE